MICVHQFIRILFGTNSQNAKSVGLSSLNDLKVHPSCFQFVLQHQIEKSRAQMTLVAGYKIIMQYQNKFVCGT